MNPCLATNCEALKEAVPEVVRESIREYTGEVVICFVVSRRPNHRHSRYRCRYPRSCHNHVHWLLLTRPMRI